MISKCALISIGLTIICISFAIFMGLFFGIVHQDIQTIRETVEATCSTLNYTVVPFRCCENDRCSCSECNEPIRCSTALTSLTAGRCCGGSACCRRRCDTCFRTETYSCGCTRRRCSTCTRSVPFECNCRCVDRVDRETCTIICGTCHNIEAIIDLHTVEDNDFIFTETTRCSLDDENCVDEFNEMWNFENRECYYNENDEELYFSEPDHNYAAIVFCGIFGFIMVTILIIFCVYSLIILWRKHKSKNIFLGPSGHIQMSETD